MIESGYKIDLPPYGFVRYVDCLGSDTRIAEAARTSYLSPSKGWEADKKLIEYLFKHRHTSPFEQCNITFEIKMPIFVMRQFVRHRTFRLNEWSGRYSELKDEFYRPNIWRRQLGEGGNKQGSAADTHPEWNHRNTDLLKVAYESAFDAYEELLKRGVAKELARIVLPVGIYTQIYVNCDLHNLMHFFTLRTDSHAQKEVQDVANAMLELTEDIFPWTMALWRKYKMKMVVDENK